MDRDFNKISSTSIQGFPRKNPYVFCYGTTVFISCFSEQTVYVYTETGNLIFARSYQNKIKQVKGFDRFLFISMENLGLGYLNFLTQSPFEAIENATIPEYYDMYYNEETDNIVIAIVMNNDEILKGVNLNRTSLEQTDNNDIISGVTSQITLSSENKDVIAFGNDSFMMRFADGTVIKRGDVYKKILNFFPYYVLSENRFVVYSTNGFFIVDIDGNIVSRFNGNLVPLNKDIFQTGFKYIGNDIIPSVEAHRLQAEDSQITTDDRLTLAQVIENRTSGIDMVKAKGSTIISGSVLSIYDGEIITNTSFNQKPVLTSLTPESEAPEDPVFRFVAIYNWSDGQGNIYRSEPSNYLSLKHSNENIDEKFINFRITNLTLTNKKNVSIDIYRTEPNKAVSFYKVLTLENDSLDKTQDFQVDIIPQAIGNELLYITGGGTANIQPEGARFLNIYNGRLYALRTTDDKRKVNISKPISEFAVNGIEFDGLSSLHFPDDITSSEVMDDKLVVFTEDLVYYYREGLREPEPITGSTNIGCVDIGASVLDKDGIYFKSKKGVYLLDRGLTLTFVGYYANVSLSKKIIKCINSKSSNEIYFLNEDGDIVVYNTFFKTFSLRNSKISRSVTARENKLYILDTQNKIYEQSGESSNVTENFNIETGWIQLSSIINRQRIREIYLLGKIDSIESIRITASYDFKDGDIFVQDLSREEINKSKVFGGSDVFEGKEIFGLTENSSIYRFFPSKEECISIKLKVEIISKSNFSISGLGFCYALQGGFSKTRVIKGD